MEWPNTRNINGFKVISTRIEEMKFTLSENGELTSYSEREIMRTVPNKKRRTKWNTLEYL